MPHPLIRFLILSASGIATLAAGFFIFQQPIQHQMAAQSADKTTKVIRIHPISASRYRSTYRNARFDPTRHMGFDSAYGHDKINEAWETVDRN